MFVEADCIRCIRCIDNELVLELLDGAFIHIANTEIELTKDKDVILVAITALN